MGRENHFIPKSKLLDMINQISTEKLEKEVTHNLQNYAEKFISDVINRSILFTKHRGSNEISGNDIFFTVEREFDYSFGNRSMRYEKNLPNDEHIEKIAEISRKK